MQTADEGKRSTVKTKKIEGIITIQKKEQTPKAVLTWQQFVKKTVYPASRVSLSTSDRRDTSEGESGKKVTQ